LKKGLIFLLICTLLLSASVLPCFANSAVRDWEGATGLGVVSGDGECPIEVLHETLTFDIPHFPDSADAYRASVSAEYTLFNPTDHEITVNLAFPFGEYPRYSFEADFDEIGANIYDITLDGKQIEKTLRHTYSSGAFEVAEDLDKLHDGIMEHFFYSPELPVTKYTYVVSTVSRENYILARVKIENQDEGRRIFVPNSSSPYEEGEVHLQTQVHNQTFFSVYVIGKDLESPFEWELYAQSYYSGTFQKVDGTVELIGTTPMTYYELAMSEYHEDADILEADWYNAVTDVLSSYESYYGITHSDGDLDVYSHLLLWYEYEITIPANGTVVNRVTAPIYPDIDEYYNPSVYTYRYLLSPASTWADFGTLEIVINTPYFILEEEGAQYQKTETGYRRELKGLPDEELRFLLCSSENPKGSGSAWGIAAVVTILGLFVFYALIAGTFVLFIVGIVFLIRALIRHQKLK